MDKLFLDGHYTTLKPGDTLHTSEDPCRYLGRVEKGSVRISRMLKSGKEIVLKEFFPGNIFADLIIFSGENYPGWIIANEESIVVEVGLPSLLTYLKKDGNTLSFLKSVSNKVSTLTNTIEILSLKTVKEKIAYLLLYSPEQVIKSLNISTLANKVGSSREAVSRTISSMVKDGILTKTDGKIKNVDSELLENILNKLN